MPSYYLRVAHGKYSGAPDLEYEFENNDEAWKEMTNICGDLAGGVCRVLSQDTDWHMELVDETRTPIFRIRLAAESLS